MTSVFLLLAFAWHTFSYFFLSLFLIRAFGVPPVYIIQTHPVTSTHPVCVRSGSYHLLPRNTLPIRQDSKQSSAERKKESFVLGMQFEIKTVSFPCKTHSHAWAVPNPPPWRGVPCYNPSSSKLQFINFKFCKDF